MQLFTRTTLFLFVLALSSCAKIMNGRKTTIFVRSENPATFVYGGDTLAVNARKATLNVPRARDTARLVVLAEGLRREIRIAPHNSVAWYMNFLATAGIGAFIDKNGPKRYTYPEVVRLKGGDTTTLFPFIRSKSAVSGDFYLSAGLPWANSFYAESPHAGRKVSSGFLGLSLGAEYYYRPQRYLSFSVSLVGTSPVPVPAPVKRSGGYDEVYSYYVSAANNHAIGRLEVGYGLSLARNHWAYRNDFSESSNDKIPATRRSTALGVIGTASWRLGRSFRPGIVYRPTLLEIGPERCLRLEHLVSINLNWSIRLSSAKQ